MGAVADRADAAAARRRRAERWGPASAIGDKASGLPARHRVQDPGQPAGGRSDRLRCRLAHLVRRSQAPAGSVGWPSRRRTRRASRPGGEGRGPERRRKLKRACPGRCGGRQGPSHGGRFDVARRGQDTATALRAEASDSAEPRRCARRQRRRAGPQPGGNRWTSSRPHAGQRSRETVVGSIVARTPRRPTSVPVLAASRGRDLHPRLRARQYAAPQRRERRRSSSQHGCPVGHRGTTARASGGAVDRNWLTSGGRVILALGRLAGVETQVRGLGR